MPSKVSQSTQSILPNASLPYFHYTSLLCTHTLLLAFTGLFLPRSTLLVAPLPPQQSSLDKPQYPFLEPITASPVLTLLWLCAGTGACQAWWAGWIRQWWGGNSDEKRKDGEPSAMVGRVGEGKVKMLRIAWANTFAASAFFHVIIVLFGAPITSHIPHTYLLSLLMAILTVFVPAYALSLRFLFPFKDETRPGWITLFVERKSETPMERALVFPVLGSFFGCWAGAFPIPLDWDRPWQAWPLTPAYSALAGHLLGSWLSLGINAVYFFASEDREQHAVAESPQTQPKKRKKKKGE